VAVSQVRKKVPITLLSGFLGAGKTTILRQALENKQVSPRSSCASGFFQHALVFVDIRPLAAQCRILTQRPFLPQGLKIAVVVNDVASINIDSKLVRERTMTDADDTKADSIELQNGCACCNASDELLQSISQLLRIASRRGKPYDRIIIEMSGVAEPKNIRREFAEAAEVRHVALELTELQTMITVVDAPSFLDLYKSKDKIQHRPELCAENEAEMEAIDSGRHVVDLLVEQVECADFLVLNKKDRCSGDEMQALTGMVTAINPTAHVLTSEWGKVPLETVFGKPKGAAWVCKADDEDDLRDAVAAAIEFSKKRKVLEASARQGQLGLLSGGDGGAKSMKDATDHGHAHEKKPVDHGHGHAHEQDHGHKHGPECEMKDADGHGHALETKVCIRLYTQMCRCCACVRMDACAA